MKRSLVEGVRSTKRHAAIKLNSSHCVLLLYILAAPLPQSDNVPCLHVACWLSASDHAVNLIRGKMLTSRRRDISHFDLASNQRRDAHRSVLKSRQLRAQLSSALIGWSKLQRHYQGEEDFHPSKLLTCSSQVLVPASYTLPLA